VSAQAELAARLGPRPLPLHLTIAGATWLSSLAGLSALRSGSPIWNSELRPRAANLAEGLRPHPPELMAEALSAEIRARVGAYLDGIARYRHHPYRRALADPPVLWRAGTTRLLDHRPEGPARAAALFVPSLINRAYVLDLAPGQSLMRHLANVGIRAFLLDWDAPGATEAGFGLDDYVLGRLGPALDAAVEAHGGPVVLVGYCMGGLLALPLALQRPQQVSALALLATPWDFAADGGVQRRLLLSQELMLRAAIEQFGLLPTDLVQALFTGLDPLLSLRKFLRFAALEPMSPAALAFVALEDWLNDGVPLIGRVARQCLFGWYGDNEPGRGVWRVGGATVDPAKLEVPSLVVVPAEDRIVPPPSAEALACALPSPEIWRPALGHIGMMASARARATIYEPLARWIVATAK